jgi:hypothetical protein
MDLDTPIDILSNYILAWLPWLAAHPALAAVLVAFGPIILFELVRCGLSRRKKKSSV